MFTVPASFIGVFKVGDNINHSLLAASKLYEVQATADRDVRGALAKPIIFLLASITEGLLYDLHFRLTHHTREGVKGIAESIANYIRGKHIDDFSKYISSAKKHKLLGATNADLYDRLEDLRKLRNRIHIQNEKNHFEPDDGKAFSLTRQKEAEQILERVMKFCATNYHRDGAAGNCVEDFNLPWSEHFP
jgi:hypothetical protein